MGRHRFAALNPSAVGRMSDVPKLTLDYGDTESRSAPGSLSNRNPFSLYVFKRK